MHVVRRLIALLLILALPAYAGAALGLPTACAGMNAPAAQRADAAHPCCQTTDAAGEEGSSQPAKSAPCKPGYQCKTGSLLHLQVPPIPQVPTTPGTLAAKVESPHFADDPAGIWRPPRITTL